MNVGEYRREFAEYNSAVYLAHYRHRAGLDSELHTEAIYDRYGELFTVKAINDLRHAANEMPESLKTERKAFHALIGAACIGFLEMQAREITEDCARRDAAIQIDWNGDRISAFRVPKAIATDSEPGMRRTLSGLWANSIAAGNDLRASRWESLYQSAQTLGSDSYQGLFSTISGTNYSQLLVSTEKFLERTESTYRPALARLAACHLHGVAAEDLTHSDFLYLQRMPWLDKLFPASSLMPTYFKAMSGLGIRAKKQENVHVDSEERPAKNPRASCFPIKAPDDIRLLVAPIGGVYDYTTLFHEAGHAQHFAWTSRELAATYPEFVYSPEYATTEGYAFLLQHLFLDSSWLMENFGGMDKGQADAVVRDLSLVVLLTVRRHCAKLKYEFDLHGSADLRSDALGANYAAAQQRATGFRRHPGLYLWDVDDGFYAAAYLRAWAFEASLREYLRTRYGTRWWAAPRAGDELIDLWNTASEYSVEELSRLIGIGDINFDLLADNLIAGVNLS